MSAATVKAILAREAKKRPQPKKAQKPVETHDEPVAPA